MPDSETRAEVSEDEPLDPLVDFVADECPTCGAYMLNPSLHRDWHSRLGDRLAQLDRDANRLTGWETYG